MLYKNDNYKDENKLLAKCILSLYDLQDGITKEINSPMQPNGNIHLFLQITKKNIDPFKDINLSSIFNSYMTFYIKVINGKEVLFADSTGLSDPFCVIELKGRKDKNQTIIKNSTLTLVWNQGFQFRIFSYNTDVFNLTLYDYDKYAKNNKLGEWTILIKDMNIGEVVDKNIRAGGLIHVIYQLTRANQYKWNNIVSRLLSLHIKVIEAKEFPNISGKTDPYLEFFF